MAPAKCPFLHSCNKYTDLTLVIDRLRESGEAKDRRIAALEAEVAALKAAQCGSPTNPADVRMFGSSTPSSLIPIGRATLRWGSGPQGLTLSASVPETLDPRAKPVAHKQAEGLQMSALRRCA